MNESEFGSACSMHVNLKNAYNGWSENVKGPDNVNDRGLDWRIIQGGSEGAQLECQ
jgi:hypothetical protein